MRMNQDERRFDFHGLGAALKRAREEKYEMEWHGLDKLLLYGSYVHRHRSAY